MTLIYWRNYKEKKPIESTWNRIGDEGAIMLSELLKISSSLAKLDLSCDEFVKPSKHLNQNQILGDDQQTVLEIKGHSV